MIDSCIKAIVVYIELEKSCDTTEWRCNNQLECISQKLVCNGLNDCSDMSDEMNCGK